MNLEDGLAIQESIAAALTGRMTFSAIIGRLAAAGVERYHTDYSRRETTAYLADGESVVVAMPFGEFPTGGEFLAADVEAAVRRSQRGEHTYLDFIRQTMAAGCVGYFVQIAGRQAQYFGRRGEVHVEPFPTTK